MTRRAFAATITSVLGGSMGWAATDRLAVVYHSVGDAYLQALEGLKPVLNRAGLETLFYDIAAPGRAVLRSQVEARGSRVLLVLGAAAWDETLAENLRLPLLAAMVAKADVRQRAAAARAATLYLDVPVPGVLAELRVVFPDRNRVGLLRGSGAGSVDDAQVSVRARQLGYTLTVAECGGAEQLLPALLSLKGKADLVLTTPDSQLFNAATVKPLVLASFENRLPLVGFSAGFVRAGAVTGVYGDPRDLGAQAGEAALRWIGGQGSGAEETPRKLVMSVNQRVARLLGLAWKERVPELEVFR